MTKLSTRRVTWTVIWYRAISGEKIQSLTNDQKDRFNNLRFNHLDIVTDELAAGYNIKR
jgi:hypothetical protein